MERAWLISEEVQLASSQIDSLLSPWAFSKRSSRLNAAYYPSIWSFLIAILTYLAALLSSLGLIKTSPASKVLQHQTFCSIKASTPSEPLQHLSIRNTNTPLSWSPLHQQSLRFKRLNYHRSLIIIATWWQLGTGRKVSYPVARTFCNFFVKGMRSLRLTRCDSPGKKLSLLEFLDRSREGSDCWA